MELYKIAGDNKYEYAKDENGTWFTRQKGSTDWIDLSSNQQAVDTLNTQAQLINNDSTALNYTKDVTGQNPFGNAIPPDKSTIGYENGIPFGENVYDATTLNNSVAQAANERYNQNVAANNEFAATQKQPIKNLGQTWKESTITEGTGGLPEKPVYTYTYKTLTLGTPESTNGTDNYNVRQNDKTKKIQIFDDNTESWKDISELKKGKFSGMGSTNKLEKAINNIADLATDIGGEDYTINDLAVTEGEDQYQGMLGGLEGGQSGIITDKMRRKSQFVLSDEMPENTGSTNNTWFRDNLLGSNDVAEQAKIRRRLKKNSLANAQ